MMLRRRSAGINCYGMSLSPPSVFGTQFLQGSSRILVDSCSLCLRSQGYGDSLTTFKTTKKSPSSSRTYGRLSLITRFVCDLGTAPDADKDSRWCNKWQSMIKSL